MTDKEEMEKHAIPIKDIVDDPNHPFHDELMELLEKLERGEVHLS